MRFSRIQPINKKKINLQLKNILIEFEKTDLLGRVHCECEGQINLKWLFEKLESLKKGGGGGNLFWGFTLCRPPWEDHNRVIVCP